MFSCIRRLYRGLLLRRARQIRHGRNVKRAVRHQYQRLLELEAIAEAEYSASRPGREGRLCMAEVMRRRARREESISKKGLRSRFQRAITKMRKCEADH